MKTPKKTSSKLSANLRKLGSNFPEVFAQPEPAGAPQKKGEVRATSTDWLGGILLRLRESEGRDDADELAQRIADQLQQWFGKNLCPAGFLIADPLATPEIFLSLDALRTLLAGVGWGEEHEAHFARVFGNLLRVRRKDELFGSDIPLSKSLAKRLAELCKEPLFRSWAKIHEPTDKFLWLLRKPPKTAEEKKPSEFANPGAQSDESAFALMRRDWSRSAEILAVHFRHNTFGLRLRALDQTIFDGQWETEITAAGKAISLLGEWESTCWHADSDGEYLELRRLLGHGLVLERQIFLARATELLWISDTIKSPLDEELSIQWRIPTPAATGISGALNTRAKKFKLKEGEFRLIPASFPAALLAPTDGKIDFLDGNLIMSSKRKAVRHYQAAAFTWDHVTLADQEPWKELTVTADRTVLSDKEAYAVRIPMKNRQIVAFRRFYPILRCAFVGYHTLDETVIGAFEPKGHLREWVTVK